MLTDILLADPSTPPATLRALVDARHIGASAALLAHPALAADHPLLSTTRVTTTILRAALSRNATNERRRALLTAATSRSRLEYLGSTPDAHSEDVRAVYDLAMRGRHRLSYQTARTLFGHPAAPSDIVREALLVVVRRAPLRSRLRLRVLSVATRHPQHLAAVIEACSDVDVRARLTGYAATGDPHVAFVADVVGSLPTDSGRAAGWVTAVADSGDPDVALAAIDDGHHAGVLRTVLGHARLPVAIAREALTRVLERVESVEHPAVRETMQCRQRALAGAAEPLVALFASKAVDPWTLAFLTDRADLSTSTLELVVERAQRYRQQYNGFVRAVDLQAWCGSHPAATPALRARVVELVTDFGCSDVADRVRWFKAGRVITALEDIDRYGYEHAGLRLPASVLRRNRGMATSQAFTFMAAAALRARAQVFEDASAVQILLKLAPSFDGTLGELLDTAQLATA